MTFKFYALLSLLIPFTFLSNAQTWTGNTSTDWNTPTNWNPANVPLPAGNVTIPTSPPGNRWPVLAGNVSIKAFNMNAGSQLNVNGFSITSTDVDLRGTINNSSVSTDINIIITSTGTSYVRDATFNDAVLYTLDGTGVFYDSYSGNSSNTYNGNVTYVRNTSGASYIGYYARNMYNGNVSISNTVAGTLDIFQSGATISGNLSVSSIGGNATIGSNNNNTLVNGTLNVTCTNSGIFGIYRVINQQNGGTISLSSRTNMDFQRDTLKLSAINISEQNGQLDISYNKIQGNITYASASGITATSIVRENQITGNVSYTLNGTNTFYDAYSGSGPNVYVGNVTYTRNGTGATYIGFYARNMYTGNLTMTGTIAATTELFNMGGDVSGNLAISSAGGILSVGNLSNNTLVGGSLTVSATNAGLFSLDRVINQQTGGSITLASRGTIYIREDTLKVTAITITEHNGVLEINENKIQGPLSYESATAITATSFVRNNEITGNVSYSLKGTNTFYDSYSGNSRNVYVGNVTYTRSGTGATYVGFYDRNSYTGNVSISATVIATLDTYNSGADISGNLTISSVGGNASIGNSSKSTLIGGMLQASGTTSGNFDIVHVINQQTGGSITLANRTATNIAKDTLLVNAINITNQSGTYNFEDNAITGNISYSSANANTATGYVRGNMVTGNATYVLNGTNTFYDSYSSNSANSYSGNVSFTRNSTGALYVGYYDTMSVGGNLHFDFSSPGAVENRFIAFTGSAPTTLSQNGNIPLEFNRISMKKTGSGSVTFEDSVRISDQVLFAGGNIVTANQKELIWLNGAESLTPSNASHVVGPVVKIGSQAFLFPVGNATAMQAVTMSAPAGTTTRFRVQYFPMNPHPTYDTSQRAAGLAAISGCEYWKVDREVGVTNVTLTFDYGAPCLCVEQPTNLRVARWSGSQWLNLGNGGTIGNIMGGTVQPAAAVTDYGVFSLGSSATVSPSVTIARSVNNPVCVCRKVTFTATPVTAGCSPGYQWKKNGQNVGTNSSTYTDSTLANGDVISLVLTSSAAFASPGNASSNSINITTTDINTWSGATSSNWHIASNWSCQSVPCALSKVIVNGGAPNSCEILSGNVKIISLTANSGSTVRVLNGSTLELKQP